MKTKYIIVAFFLSIGLSSCVVSKKKYDTLTLAKQASDRKVRNLLKEKNELEQTVQSKENTINSLSNKLKDLKSEFNNLKYDMSASNAQKSSEIDKLTKKLDNSFKKAKSVKEKSEEMEGDLNWLRKVRQQNTEKIDSLQTTIKSLEVEVENLKNAKESATNSKAAAEQKITDLTSKVNALEELLNREKATNAKLQEQLKSAPAKTKEEIPEI